MKDKKVYLLTFQRPINFGAALQAIATLQYLKFKGYDAYIVNYRHKRIENNRKLIGSRYDENNSFIKNIKSIIRDLLNYKKEASIHYKFDKFVEKYANLTNECNDQSVKNVVADADVIVVGSDLVWNWELDKELNDVFFLNFEIPLECEKISYASSIGSSGVPEELKPLYKSYLSKFNFISVRESSTQAFLSELLHKEVSCVVDPTLQLSAYDWMHFEKRRELPEQYILIYLLEDEENAAKIAEISAQHYNLPVLYYSRKKRQYGKESCYNYIDAGPDEFLYLIHHAEFIVTNSFHGTAFSVIYDKPFVSIPHSTRGCRMVDFLEKIGANTHCCSDYMTFDISECQQKLSEKTETSLNEWIEISRAYIDTALENHS